MKSHKEIIFVNQSAGYLMIDIINAHVPHYDKITLITGKIIQRQTPLHPSVSVKKIIAYNRTSTVKRLLTWGIGFLQIMVYIWLSNRKALLFLVSNPPFTSFIPLLCVHPYKFLVYDIYPEALTEYKILREDALIVRFWRKINHRVFSKAKSVYTLSSGMQSIIGKYRSTGDVNIVPVWTDNDFLKPVPKNENKFIQENNLAGKFLVMYSGNLGYSHSLDVILDIAKETKQPNIVYTIIGDGDKRSHLKKRIENEQIDNCLLLPWQDTAMLPYSLSAADIGIVSLGKEASLLSVPSKTFNLMSVGVPLLCIAASESELAKLVQLYLNGRCFSDTDKKGIFDYIHKVYSDETYKHELSNNSYCSSKDFGKENALKMLN
jgi:glycosyltransferase involved in cell wall biosynthesis